MWGERSKYDDGEQENELSAFYIEFSSIINSMLRE